jgi:hypothetical protein
VEASTDPTERLSLGGIPVAVYVAMFCATLGGQLAGIVLDALFLGRHALWVPLACSVVLEAGVGARMAAARLGRSLLPAQCARLSATYSVVLAAISLPLWGWTVMAKAPRDAPVPSPADPTHGTAATLGLVLAAFAIATVVRFGLMLLASPRTGKKASVRP